MRHRKEEKSKKGGCRHLLFLGEDLTKGDRQIIRKLERILIMEHFVCLIGLQPDGPEPLDPKLAQCDEFLCATATLCKQNNIFNKRDKNEKIGDCFIFH